MQIKTCIYTLFAAFMPSTIQAMLVSQALVPVEQNNVLVLGTYHSGNKDQAKTDAHRLVEILQSLMHGAHIIVEINEHSLTNQVSCSDSFIEGVIQEVSGLKKEGKTRNVLIAGDERPDISVGIGVRFQVIKQLYLRRQARAKIDDPTIVRDLHSLEEYDFSSLYPGSSIVLADYYKHLDANLESMRAIQRIYMPKNPFVEQLIQGYLKAYKKIKGLLQHESPHGELGKMLIRLFYHCNTAEKLFARLEEMSQCFVIDTDCSFATLIFLKKLFDLASSNKNIVMVLGNLHAMRLKSIFENAGKKILYNQSIMTHSQDGTFIEGNPRAAAESAFSLARQFVGLSNLSTVAQHLSQTQCVKCLGTENLKRCSRCKKVMYCGAACQAQDWPQHKNGCKPALVA